MDVRDYFDFIDDENIRIKGHRIYIDDVLEEYLFECKTPEELLYRFPTLNFEKIHATLLYYEANKAEVQALLLRVKKYRKESYQRWLETEGATPEVVERRERLERYRQKKIAEGDFYFVWGSYE